MNNKEAVNWLINISADIGKAEHSDLWHYEQALTEIKDMLESAQPEERTKKRTETHTCDLISRQAAIDAIHCDITVTGKQNAELVASTIGVFVDRIKALPSAQPEQKIYRSMSEEEFEAWLYNHGICHPDIHESIACDIVPSLIDDAINELPPAQPEEAIPVSWIEAKIKRFMTMDNAFGGLTANIMLVMLNEWKREQEGETE